VNERPPRPQPRREAANAGGKRRTEARLLYGINPIQEALNAGHRILDAHTLPGKVGPELKGIIASLRAAKVPISHLDRHGLSQLCGNPKHQGLVAQAAPLTNGSLTGLMRDHPDEALTVVVLDRIQDPQNLGAIYRVADAMGVSLIFLPAGDAVSHQLGSVAKASAGAVEHVPTVVVADLRTPLTELKGHGFAIVGLATSGTAPIRGNLLHRRLAIVLGSEGAGLSKNAAAACHSTLSIPMRGKVDSLNAAQALGITLYERSCAVAADDIDNV
jgi:23S rRNA (guanosine2251-2'-O)-methyltransferase